MEKLRQALTTPIATCCDPSYSDRTRSFYIGPPAHLVVVFSVVLQRGIHDLFLKRGGRFD
ncbi:hypothetical protein SBA5_1070015 [Candidatus Sulfotelmatomonas gaucii]|uniref:Uncharacterized protein n=1 Tax=Candidatus Sulfuritelmatomonas gaucii TaxID=2043161 RepID=A0A2N9L2R9_9BACT|nr:hypothetical protein SBA5_1070015 [Candidatus Sulfotelmatomonas gaucii]